MSSTFVSHKEIVDSFYDSYELNPVICDIVVPYKKTSSSSRKRKRKLNAQPQILRTSKDDLPKVSHIQILKCIHRLQHIPEILSAVRDSN